MDDDKIKEILEKALSTEMFKLDLSLVSGSERRRQDLLRASAQLEFIAKELDKYANIPKSYNMKIQDIISEVNNLWESLRDEQ